MKRRFQLYEILFSLVLLLTALVVDFNNFGDDSLTKLVVLTLLGGFAGYHWREFKEQNKHDDDKPD